MSEEQGTEVAPPLQEAVGKRIAALREKAGISQAAVGAALVPYRSHAAVSDIERGKTTLGIDLLAQIASVLRCDLATLIGVDSGPRRGGNALRLKLVCNSRNAVVMVLYDLDSGRHLECANVDIHFHPKGYVTATVECLIEAVEYTAEEQA